jgi:hypothetical protein
MAFDPSRAHLGKPDKFPRFTVPDAGVALRSQRLSSDEPLLVIQRGEKRRAFIARQMAWHHVAQGRLAGEPYVVTF